VTVTFIEEYRTDDKSDWGEGAWQSEPDKVVWVDQATGLDCMAHRNGSGAWCGYVGVPEGHRAYGRGYDDVNVVCHGGLTYADLCAETQSPEHGLCHIPQAGRPAEVWWLGFDCAHWQDFCPAMAARLKEIRAKDDKWADLFAEPYRDFGEHYRDLGYVVSEATALAHQLAHIS
jgi:hypothetical protein